ncbi:putative reverse transcriptase domain-containing protein [Tanacetum coccineum]
MIKESVDAAIAAERARHVNAGNDARGSGPVRGQDPAPFVRECTFAGFMKCNPAVFREDKKVKFVAATLQGPALTWWNSKVATMGLETMNRMPWTEMKQLMTAEFCPVKEIQRMEHELWNLRVKEYNIVAEEKAECKKLKKELEEARFSNTLLRMQNERVEKTEIDVPVEDEKSPSSELVDAAIAAERARHANDGNDARGSGPVRGQDPAPVVRECTFAGFMKCNPAVFRSTEGAVELRRWFEKTESVFGINKCAEDKKVKFAAATLQGPALTWWNSKVATMGLETMNRMPWTEMKQLMTAEFCPVKEIQRMEHEL